MSALSSIRNGLTSSGSSIIVGIIIFGLVATFGGFLGEGSVLSNNSILTINGKSISQGEFAIEFGRIEEQLSQGDQNLSDDLIESIVKESIVLKELYFQSAVKAGLNMDDKKLNSVIRNDPSFYNDDSFDIDLFRGFLSRLGMTPDSFKEYVKSKYLAVDLQTILSKDINFSNKFIRQFIEANNQTRDITFEKILLADEALKENVTQEEINDYYENNKFLYVSPLEISYRLLNVNQELFEDLVFVSEEEIEDERKAILNNYQVQKKISHIEITYNDSDREEKLELIQNILLDLKNESLSFENAVLEFSTDLSTKNKKGDLGFTDGSIFPDEFENVIKKLEPNQISTVIDLATSFHVIKVTEKTDSTISREDIIERITFVKTSEKLNDFLNYLDENIFIIDIETLTKEFGLNYENIANETEDKFFNKFDSLDFDEIEEGSLLGPLESDEGYNIVQIDDITDQGFMSLDEVNNEIEKELKTAKASKKFNSLVENLKNKLISEDVNFTKYSEIKRNNLLLPSEVSQKLFSFEISENDIFSVTLDSGDAYVIKLDKINENKGVVSSEDIDQGKNYLTTVYQDIIRESFINELRKSSSIN